jgi:hypothetical protein
MVRPLGMSGVLAFAIAAASLAAAQDNPYPQCTKVLSPGCTAAKAKLSTLPYIEALSHALADGAKVRAGSDSSAQCSKTMRTCTTATGNDGSCCDISFDWSNYTADVTLLTATGNDATGGGGSMCFMDEVIVIKPPPPPRTGVYIQTNSFLQLPAFFPGACLNSVDMQAFESMQSCICKAAVPTLAFCNQTYAC